MGATARMVSGKLGRFQVQGLLKVITRADRVVVRVADTDDLVVLASDITKIEGDRGFADHWPALRIDHVAEDVPSPIILFLPLDHPVCRDIERLRPDVVVVRQESSFSRWFPRAARLVWGLGIVAAIMVIGVVEGNVVSVLPYMFLAMFITAANYSRKW